MYGWPVLDFGKNDSEKEGSYTQQVLGKYGCSTS